METDKENKLHQVINFEGKKTNFNGQHTCIGVIRYDSRVPVCCCLGFLASKNAFNALFVSKQLMHVKLGDELTIQG